MMRAQRGWTLLELMIVIAIILVLAGIIYAIGAYAMERSRQATCISNLRQIGIALKLYMDDHKQSDWETEIGSIEDSLLNEVRSEQLADRWGFPRSLRDLVRGGYLKDARLLRCPSARPPLANGPVHYLYPRPEILEEINKLRILRMRMYEYPIVCDVSHARPPWRDLYIVLRMNGQVEVKILPPGTLQFSSLDL
ncbi:MAG: hypothetical protein CFK49_05455 [Armatimonadetes bacterium JP3_11]|nr:MAG: hypothetical protein CFK49_05455 [Armatimonadetes bacterium JP3_11]RMH10346.1 MAG: type II secretion system protein [Armatimonadota bacterium]